MKITQVELIPVTSPLALPFIIPNTIRTAVESVLIKIHTDEGYVGYADSGNTSSWYRGETQWSILGAIAELIAPKILIGEDPRNIE